MDKINLFWAVVWGIVFVAAVVGFFWNPIHFFTAVFAGCFFTAFIVDYVRAKRRR